ncbi:hypothetical protein AAG570_002061 [Ranatra chinensis]|uniref:C2H2-type domain-containing protein n=1 Tax=Ranatra chinensis TaxID=642074 RepID=A0ABD0YAC5_9HEMI
MASCDVQVVNPAVLSRIESFLNDAAYREAIDNSANYNTRLCLERRLRLPFLDSQTGIAQNHSNLFMSGRERIPGQVDGQLYTYPSKRWRKKRRQYLMQPQVQLRRCDLSGVGGDLHSISTIENPAVAGSTDDSKDSNSTGLKDDPSGKSSQDAWFYDELELQGMDGYDDVDPDSDYDYEETYSKRRKKRGGGAKPGPKGSSGTPASTDSPHPKKGTKGTGQGRGRKKGVNYGELLDSEKPFSCDLCGARYKTRPGLTYHYTHSHKDGRCAGTSASGTGSSAGAGAAAGGGGGMAGPPPASTTASGLIPVAIDEEPSSMDLAPMSPQQQHNSHQDNPAPGWTKFQDSYLTFLNAPGKLTPYLFFFLKSYLLFLLLFFSNSDPVFSVAAGMSFYFT